MKHSLILIVASVGIMLSGCGKSLAEKEYLAACTRELPEKVCSCSYDMLEERHGEDAINAMYESKKLTGQFKSHLNESLMYCNDLYR